MQGIPDQIEDAYARGLLVGVVQFGSSLHSRSPNDIDLAVVTRRGRFSDYTATCNPSGFPDQFDVSLIREEELGENPFRFGSHGPHLVLSLKRGRALLGSNPFLFLPDPPREAVLSSVYDRLADYVYILRKSYFVDSALSGVERRYGKFLRLSVLFFDPGATFPEVLSSDLGSAAAAAEKHGIIFGHDVRNNVERLWESVSAARRRS